MQFYNFLVKWCLMQNSKMMDGGHLLDLMENLSWNLMKTSPLVVSNGDYSEILITLNKPDELTDEQFNQRMEELEEMVNHMKQILESSWA